MYYNIVFYKMNLTINYLKTHSVNNKCVWLFNMEDDILTTRYRIYDYKYSTKFWKSYRL